MQELTDEQILTVARRKFRDGHTVDPAKLHAYCDTVRTVIACYNLEPVTQAARDVLTERRRQIEQEHIKPRLDNLYRKGQLAAAAGCYLLFSDSYPNVGEPPPQWPFADPWWKPKDYRRDVLRAAALTLAELERIDRAAAK
ncbi:hypothetical protein DF046_36815 [Burkholderia cepacia]|uniref:hypothetical protein n=1 Tax=Burkholderia cepacia TaxID=292 RepID=UPI000F5AF4E8|nr:hypothetical protein [Burkholderia cepacia]RQT43142.1 hypothetical protein DF046_36815 [Burkholderia cepacia]